MAETSHKRQLVDWAELLLDLRRARLTERKIMRLTGISRGAIYRLKRGGEPGHSDGESLLQLWREATGAHDDAVPQSDGVAIRRWRHHYRAASGPDSGRPVG